MTDTGTESLPHYDVEVTPISSINYQLLKKATIDALKQFQTDCSGTLPAEFTNYLDALMGEIDSTHKAHDLHIASSSSSSSSFKPIPKPVSQQMNNKGVNEFISNHKDDAVFLVTGGSFNPPHNGHIRMFQLAYNELLKKYSTLKDKKVYGVMVPATENWLKNKTDSVGKKLLTEPQIISLENRVNLCALSCQYFEWADANKFGAENMIIVTD